MLHRGPSLAFVTLSSPQAGAQQASLPVRRLWPHSLENYTTLFVGMQ
jgi:hypothetical protein